MFIAMLYVCIHIFIYMYVYIYNVRVCIFDYTFRPKCISVYMCVRL